MISCKEIGNRISNIRKDIYDMSQCEFAVFALTEMEDFKSHYYYNALKESLLCTMWRLEHGHFKKIGNIIQIANKTRISLHYLMTGCGVVYKKSDNIEYSLDHFKTALKHFLTKSEMTYMELADVTQIPIDTINSYARSNGSTPRLENLEKIVNVLGVTYDQLFVEPKEEEP